jgi:anti-sigma regulatory factor (Ser/Thr protein kinase)
MTTPQQICVTDPTQVGEARRKVAELCKQISSDETFIGRASIVATELANNMVFHAKGGQIIATSLYSLSDNAGLELLALDQGPGIEDVNESLRDGFSTRGTAGTGLGSIRRLTNGFEIISKAKHGTIVRCELWQDEPTSRRVPQSELPNFITGALSLPHHQEDVCGDAWATVSVNQGRYRAIIVDGLGHGPAASHAAVEAVRTFRSRRDLPVADCMREIHEKLRGSRGAAATLVELRPDEGAAVSVGVGNVMGRILCREDGKHLVSTNGILGVGIARIQEFRYRWTPEDVLVLHSDGILNSWRLDPFPGITSRHPSLIAGVISRDYRRQNDDSTVLVVRQLQR